MDLYKLFMEHISQHSFEYCGILETFLFGHKVLFLLATGGGYCVFYSFIDKFCIWLDNKKK
jgi:hypothetical protein